MDPLINQIEELVPEINEPLQVPKTRVGDVAKREHQRAVEAYQELQDIKTAHEELNQGVKRKVSQMCDVSAEKKRESAEELLDLLVQDRRVTNTMILRAKSCLNAQFNYGVIEESSYQDQI